MLKYFMRYRGNKICPDEQTKGRKQRHDKQPEDVGLQ